MQSSNSGHTFAQIPKAEIPRSSFNRSSGLKTTFDGGFLIPVWCDEALPGDTFTMRMHTFARLGTPLHPILDNMHLDSFFFAVPIRLVWDDWEHFNGAQDDPGDPIAFTIPQMVSPGGDAGVGSLSDYLGVPIGEDGSSINLTHSSLWHRAYNLIWNTHFRDENLQDALVVDKDAGPDTYGSYVLKRRGKRHDYFSSCLPFAQKGASPPLIVSGVVPVTSTGDGIPTFTSDSGTTIKPLASSAATADANFGGNFPNTANVAWSATQLEADLSDATSNTINELRQAFQIQRLLERDARGGTRYTEIIRSHFGVTSPDQRLQRPEYLGGGSQNISVTPVPTSSRAGTGAILGELGGYGTSSGSNHAFNKSFTEHCVLIGLVSVRADLTYQMGLPRMFSRLTRYDFFWPAFSHLGEQSVLNKEIWADGTANDNLSFGFQERWAEYRYAPSRTSGLMRSNALDSLDVWHLAQEFATLPTLADTFIQDTPPIDRIIAVPSEPHFLFDAFFELKCVRPMPTYSVPGLIDHF